MSFGAVVSLTAVLLVFQYGQPRIFFAMARDGLLPAWAARSVPKRRVPHITTLVTGLAVALGALVARRERDLRPHQHRHAVRVRASSASACWCCAMTEPDRPRPFRVPFVWPVTLLGAAGCLYTMLGLPRTAWERFGIWLVIGALIYFLRLQPVATQLGSRR